MTTDMHVIKARLIDMIEYAEALENELDEKASISRDELREYFSMADHHFFIGDLLP